MSDQVYAGLYLALFGLLIWFLKQQINAIKENTESNKNLSTSIQLLQQETGQQKRTCTETHLLVNKRLDKHSDTLQKHTEDLIKVKSHLKIAE